LHQVVRQVPSVVGAASDRVVAAAAAAVVVMVMVMGVKGL
jgi:hypothetical protein